jgi:5-amino-6-(5-phospho-D-ribitylamino)uracil phosphatase
LELIVFDLDGTLLNRRSEISDYTRETLRRLADQGVAYTVATGRTLHASREILQGQGFHLPHIYKNGVMIWQPGQSLYSYTCVLTQQEIQHVLEAVLAHRLSPFIFTLEPGNRHAIYHPPLSNEIEIKLAEAFRGRDGVAVLPLSELPAAAEITNVSAMGEPQSIDAVASLIEGEPNLVAYTGVAMEGNTLKWMDIHHSEASKGDAVSILKEELGVDRVLCFGDSDNDLSLFQMADECYAPDNAKDEVKSAATEVIGHHDEDGIARFLRQRFSL